MSDKNSEQAGNIYLMQFLSEIRNILSCLGRFFEDERANKHLESHLAASQSDESLIADDHRSDLSSDEAFPNKIKDTKDVDVSPNSA